MVVSRADSWAMIDLRGGESGLFRIVFIQSIGGLRPVFFCPTNAGQAVKQPDLEDCSGHGSKAHHVSVFFQNPQDRKMSVGAL
jgi:hypothetical protein